MWHAAEEFTLLTDLRKHDKTSWLFRRGFQSLISHLARVHKSPLHKVVASCLFCISHELSTVRTCAKWWVLHSIKQMNMSSHKAKTTARIAWSIESISLKAFPVQLRLSTRCLGFSHGKGAKTADTAERTQDLQWPSTPQTKARLPAHAWQSYTTCFLFESRHPTVSVLISKRYVWSQSVASKNLTTNGFIRMTYWYSNHPNRSICRTSGALV